jgi:hypothetical protein
VRYLVGDAVFVAPTLDYDGEPRRVGPLSDYVGALAARANPPRARLGGVLGEAHSYGQQLEELAFCLNQLVPLLRTFKGLVAHREDDAPGISAQELQDLKRRATDLGRHLERPLPPVATAEALTRWLRVPCAVASGFVFPLERVARPAPAELHVRIDGDLYRLRVDGRRPLQEFTKAVRREAEVQAQQVLMGDAALVRMALRFLDEVKRILNRYRPQVGERYLVLHHDRYHQLQHRFGHWALIRGPVERRTGNGAVFIGLHVHGCSRRDRLSLAPRPVPTQEGFWTPNGDPLHGGICMGDRRQYVRLLSDRFTDAEAVVEWLDAGTILVSGRSDLHRNFRAERASRLRGRTLAV